MSAKLIILRGPSGAGKSTVARELQRLSDRNIAIIEQDRYRQDMFKDQEGSSEVRHIMLLTDCLIALEHGYDVILEGILSLKSYQGVFNLLFDKHLEENYMFYFDVSYEETVKRHSSRAKSADFGPKEMKEWYTLAQPSEYKGETILSETMKLDEIIAQIRQKTSI